jgi:ComF family protein
MNAMPATGFEWHYNNPIEKILSGRLPLIAGTAQYYYTDGSLMQQLIHEFKYNGDKELGLQLGQLMGVALKRSARIIADALVPLPLFPDKERKRGFNQSELLCEGIAGQLNIPVLKNAIARLRRTETQTRKGRIERWRNMDGTFAVKDPASVNNKHILLVDDVLTTGATLEACGSELIKTGNVQLSVACLCFASR